VRVFQALSKSKEPLTRSEISKKGEVDQAMLTEYIGSSDDKIRLKNDKKVCKSLLTHGYVKATDKDGANGLQFLFTADYNRDHPKEGRSMTIPRFKAGRSV
jgi:hypothetical protein